MSCRGELSYSWDSTAVSLLLYNYVETRTWAGSREKSHGMPRESAVAHEILGYSHGVPGGLPWYPAGSGISLQFVGSQGISHAYYCGEPPWKPKGCLQMS